MKKSYFIVKLAPQVSSWCDMQNNICLSRPNKVSRRLKEGCDMKMIRKGVKAGLLILEEHFEECEQKQEPVVEPIPEPVAEVPAEETAAEAVIKKVRKRRKEEVKVEVNVIEEDKEDKE